MNRIAPLLLFLFFSLNTACGDKAASTAHAPDSTDTDTDSNVDTDTSDSDTDTSDSADSDTDSGEHTDSGDHSTPIPERNSCESDSDCGGDPCIEVGDAKVCQRPTNVWAHDCNSIDPNESECCDDSECNASPDGFCVAFSVGYCGGPAPMDANTCRYHECNSDADCTGTCLPAGVLGAVNSTCLNSGCNSDSDCTDGSDGQCALLYNSPTCPEAVLSCVYTDAECRRAEGCDNGHACVADASVPGGASCQELMPPAK